MTLSSLTRDKGVKICEPVPIYMCYSKSKIYIHAKLSENAAKTDCRKLNKWRPNILNIRNEFKKIRSLFMLVETSDSFSIKRLKLESRVDDHISINTIIRILQHNSYYYLNHEWKIWCQGMMAEHDHFL